MNDLLVEDYNLLKERCVELNKENQKLRDENNIYKNKAISKNAIINKIKELEKEKNFYYSDWKLEEIDTQIEILKEILWEE